jgi:hypothetical protein
MSRYTRLETAVMQALAWDLREVVPDLAGQFEDSLPGLRRNTGSGLSTEMIVSAHRPPSGESATGAFGSVHAMVGDLPDPVAFRAVLRQGRLLSLEGDSYGQDTSALDFATVPFDQVFTVDEAGESVAFDPADHMAPSPLLDLQTWIDPAPEPPVQSRLVNIGALQRVQEIGAPPPSPSQRAAPQPYDALMESLFGAAPEAKAALSKEEKTTLRVGLWMGLFVLVSLWSLALGLPWQPALLVAFLAGRFLHTESGLVWLKRGCEAVKRSADRRETS